MEFARTDFCPRRYIKKLRPTRIPNTNAPSAAPIDTAVVVPISGDDVLLLEAAEEVAEVDMADPVDESAKVPGFGKGAFKVASFAYIYGRGVREISARCPSLDFDVAFATYNLAGPALSGG